ncbi:hypothetical protein HDU67_006481 [Dinochytrium kinnereticum]|nr:hypothetical protein HDU67_006481 [Dinochytrium kinnereticum]
MGLLDGAIRFINDGDDEAVLKIANQLLGDNASDVDAFVLKVVALIRLDKFRDALAYIEGASASLKKEVQYEHAYCLYREHKHKECSELIESAKKTNLSGDLAHLELQLLYRTEQYDLAKKVSDNIVTSLQSDDPYVSEIMTNLSAVNAFSVASGKSAELPSLDISETYETAYNRACIFISLEDFVSAENWLNIAKKRCTDVLREDGCSEDTIAKELTIIITQLAYVYQRTGRKGEAEELYLSILQSKLGDSALLAIASNNLISIRGHKDLFDSVKRYRTTLAKGLDQKLTTYQRKMIALNGCVLSLLMKKFSVCKEQVQKLMQEFGNDPSLFLMQAGILLAEKGGLPKAIDYLKSNISLNSQSIVLVLGVVELYLRSGDATESIKTLEEFVKNAPPALCWKPFVVSVLACLYKQAKMLDKAVELINSAVKSWQSGSNDLDTAILRQTAAFKLECCRFIEAAKDYEQLVRKDSSDVESIAGLIMTYSEADLNAAQKYASYLPSKSSVFGKVNIDVDGLESAPPIKKSTRQKKDEKSTEPSLALKAKKIRKKKPRTDKVFDKSVIPDPERWMPRYERAAFKKKAGKKDLLKGPQGSAVAGGGIGGTGSANIGGRTSVAAPQAVADADVEMKDANRVKLQEIHASPQAQQKKKKNKKK